MQTEQSMVPVPQAKSAACFPEPTELIERIKKACVDRSVDDATIAVCVPDGDFQLSIGRDGNVAESRKSDGLHIAASCMTKLYTATLALECFAQRGISLDHSAQDLLRDLYGTGALPALQGVTLRQLLNSSHGLDDPRVDAYEAARDGFIDFERLYARFTDVPALISPGVAFSYSEFGMLALGAILERLSGRRFGELLTSDLLSSRRAAEDYICPATGGQLSISAADLVALAQYYFSPDKSALLQTVRSTPIEFPGSTTMGEAVCLGWFRYAGGWYGYSATTRAGGLLTLRMQPEQRVAIALVSKSSSAAPLMHSAFADVLPEYRDRPVPRLLTYAQLTEFDRSELLGCYECAALAATIEETTNRVLQITISNRTEPGLLRQPLTRTLRLIENRGFLTTPVDINFIPRGQIVEYARSGQSQRYLWSGRRLWRKVA